ncbi:MAG: uroporphyrinogen-III C-methyltransferase [Azoarcus sp.]|nr:uroporphyrinogen-III C-methyltransferase [Azoarcus sp.]
MPESGAVLEQAPSEPSSAPPEGESTVSVPEPPSVAALEQAPSEPPSAPPEGESTVSAPEPPSVAALEQAPSEPSSAPPASESTVSASAPPSGVPPAPVTAGQRNGRNVAGWALLLALASIGIAVFSLWQAYDWRAQNADLREEVAKRLQENDNAIIESRALAKREHENLNTVLGKVGALEGQINKSEGHARALETLYEQFARSQEDQIVAEVRQAVDFADQQLRYAGNIETALIALRGAQNRLEQNDHGQFSGLRQALGTDIEKLSRQGTLDMPGTAQRLEHVLEKIDELPPAYSSEISTEKSVSESGENGEGVSGFFSRLADGMWTELRSLVRFERLDENAEPVLLAPEQSAFLRENVKIRLLTARLAMLARDGHSYHADLEKARSWIERFFDMSNEDVKAVVKELRELEAIPVGVIRHELIESATAVRRFQTRGGEPAPTPSPPQQQQAPQQQAPQSPPQNETSDQTEPPAAPTQT